MCGGVVFYAAQTNALIDAEIAEKSCFWTANNWSKKDISRVLFFCAVTCTKAMIIHLEPLLPTVSSNLTRKLWTDRPQTFPYLVLLRMGFTELSTSPPKLVSSYLTLSPLSTTTPGVMATVSFLWHFPWGHPRFPLGTILSCGARTFLPPGINQASDHLSFFNQVSRLDFCVNKEDPVTVRARFNFLGMQQFIELLRR